MKKETHHQQEESGSEDQNLAALSLSAFDQMVAATTGFRPRAGQRDMAQRIALALHGVSLGDHDHPDTAIAVIQAGTGVGKSAAYLSTTVAMALQRKTRVVVSTATVALQEQLMTKDLPALAESLDVPFVYALAKGRGRYVCKLKLERLAGPSNDDIDDLLGIDDDPASAATFTKSLKGHHNLEERRTQLYDTLVSALAAGSWNGDRDSLSEPPDPQDWGTIAAERHTCTVRHCPRFRDCSYYNARTLLSQAQVIVANHDLVLSSLGKHALPDPDNCLMVFDEGHHLPAVALDQFASEMNLTHLRWLDKMPGMMMEVAEKLGFSIAQDVTTLAYQLKAALHDASRMAMDMMQASSNGYDVVHRFPNGVLPEFLTDPMTLIQGHSQGLLSALNALGTEIKRQLKEDPAQAAHHSVLFARLGQMSPKLSSVVTTSTLLLTQGEPPMAKWLKSDTSAGLVAVTANACPIVPGDLLRQHLWSKVRGAVITSASLTTCGSFDYFLGEAGLDDLPQVSTLAVSSPFDYSTQGQLVVVETVADPRHVEAYTSEMVVTLLEDLRLVEHGALVLFTSRVQMKSAVEALDGALLDVVLVQGQMSRQRLLNLHAQRIESGLASVIFGLQSFGEGLDLPGLLCETVFIAKLPFGSPADPVHEARSEWLKSQGQDPFNQLVVPATGIRLLQWTGRAIRSETDQAKVVCYDKRLLTTAYGQRMLQGLPPYARVRRKTE